MRNFGPGKVYHYLAEIPPLLLSKAVRECERIRPNPAGCAAYVRKIPDTKKKEFGK